MRKLVLLALLVLSVCAWATTASAGFGVPGPTPDSAMTMKASVK
ncbi:MAG TPA: hypothetical protein VGK74_16760 [Symbiobacteriaceae bacterium]